MGETISNAVMGSLFLAFFVVAGFPGGTILMAVSCNSRSLDGWDWVLSVVVPMYGFFVSAGCW